MLKRVPQAEQSDEQLLSWVRKGVQSPPPAAFQTDGTVALFSALKPEPSPKSKVVGLWRPVVGCDYFCSTSTVRTGDPA